MQNDLGPSSIEKPADAIKSFIIGFGEGLLDALGFDTCIQDIDSTYTSIGDLVTLQKSGIDLKKPSDVLSAFEKLGPVLKDFAEAIYTCVKAGHLTLIRCLCTIRRAFVSTSAHRRLQ